MNAISLAVTGAGVLSHAGPGLAPLGRLLRGGPAPEAVPAPDDMPPRRVRAVPGFRLADHFTRKGTRNIDRNTALGLVAAKEALADSDAAVDGARCGVVVATSTGSVRSTGELARESLTGERPYMVNPARFPNAVMNSCAGQIAIWNSLRGVNSTVAGGSVSSVHAVRYARLAIGQGSADTLLVGGVEELNPLSAWAWHGTRALTPGAALGEGCAMFVAESAETVAAQGRASLAEIPAAEVAFAGAAPDFPSGLTAALASCVGRALRRAGIDADEVDVVAPGATGQKGLALLETRAVERVLGREPRFLRVGDALGECYSAGGALQLAALLALWAVEKPSASSGVALVTSVGRDGQAGCLVVRRGDR